MTSTIEIESLKKLRSYCAYRERCKLEVEIKAQTIGAPKRTILELIQKLEEDGFINEARFANLYAVSKFNNHQWGKERIFNELKARKIDDKTISYALLKIDDKAYLSTLKKLFQKKWSSFKKAHPLQTKKAATYRYLKQKGWESYLINDLLSKIP